MPLKNLESLLDDIVVHELVNLIEPSHNESFKALVNHHCPMWQEARNHLNTLPLGADL